MATKKKRILSLLLALVLIFGIFAVSASAVVYKTGKKASVVVSNNGATMTGTVTGYSDRAYGVTKLTKTGATINVSVCLDYATPASPNLFASVYAHDSGTTFADATAYKPNNSQYVSKYAYAGHTENAYDIGHLETVDAI